METKEKVAYYPGAQPTTRIAPVKVKASRQGVAEILDMQGAWVASVGDLNTARYIARCINANEKLVAALRGIIDCARARNVNIDKAAECDAIASTILRELGEPS